MVVELVQKDFQERVLAEEATYKVVVLTPKGDRDYRVIGSVEVMWKAVAVILNCCFNASITYHKSFHGLQAGHSTGTATVKVKLLWQVTACNPWR